MSDEITTGSCHCGKIKYKAYGPKRFEFLCHCLNCRKLNGGGHLSGIVFPNESFQVEGEPKMYPFTGGSGQNVESYFCSDCSTPLYAFPKSHPDIVVLRANSLDDDGVYEPKKSLFHESAFKWDKWIID